MNVKFRMPRFEKVKMQSMLREVTMTIIATTISIVLTFGSASIVEQRQKEKNRRQAVMMVIHDMENTISAVKDQKESEERQINLTHYVQNHLAQIESIRLDTLTEVFNYLLEKEFVFDYLTGNSIEKLFQENQSLWSSLDDNMVIIDYVQLFFNMRRGFLDVIHNNSFWEHPISKQERLELLCEGSKDYIPLKVRQILKEKLYDPRVLFFLQYSPYRQSAYDNAVDQWQYLADRLKFMLGITDEELESFIETHQQLGRIATKKDIIGEWVRVDSMNKYVHHLYEKDKTFYVRNKYEYKNSFYSGKIVGILSFEGTWAFKGDTLIEKDNPNSFGYSMDVGRIKYSERVRDSISSSTGIDQNIQNRIMRDSVDAYIQEIKNGFEETKRWFKQGHVYKYILRIDKSGNKMEVTNLGDGSTEPSTYYLKRINKNEQ